MTAGSSLRVRLLRQFLLLGVLPVLVLAAAAALLVSPFLQKEAEERNRELAYALRDQMQLQLVLRRSKIALLASQLDGRQSAPELIGHTLQTLVRDDPFVQAAYVVDASGLVVEAELRAGSGRFAADAIGADLSGQDHYRHAREAREATWSNTFLSTLTGRITVVLAVPADDRSVVVEFALEGLSKSLSELMPGNAVRAIVVDRLGRVVAHPDETLALRQESLAMLPIVRRAMDGRSSSGRTTIDGVDYFAHALPAPAVGWSVLALQPVDAVMAPLRRTALVLGALLGAVVAGAVAASWRFAQRTGREVTRLAAASEAAAGGGVQDMRLEFATAEFGRMWVRLRELFAQLHLRDQQTQAARQDLQAVLDAATEVAVVATDVQGVVKLFNVGAARMLGRRADSVIGCATPMLWHDADEVRARAAELSARHGTPVEGFDAVLVEARRVGYEVRDWKFARADGSVIDVSLAVTCVRTPSGEVTGFLCVAVDVTEQRHAAQLEVARRSAELASRAKSELLSRVSHELRTPLNAMLGYAQLMEADPQHGVGAGQRERVQQIQRAGWHLVKLIDDVLDLSRIEAGNVKVAFETVDARALVGRAAQLVAPEFARFDVSLDVRWGAVDAAAGWALSTDPTRLTQVLVNLLGNAAKYNRRGGTVVVDGQVQDRQLVLAVRDSGRGMTAEQLSRLFQPFDRLGLEASGISGTGIGLVISKSLIELLHGTIEVNSVLGRGSTFTLRLPLAEVQAPAAPAEPARPSGLGQPPAAAPRTGASAAALVLYIEDNEVNAELMRAVLCMRSGVELSMATTIASGLARARQRRPDVILLDMHLPDGTGLDALEALRADPELGRVPVVVVSADATRQRVEDAIRQGAHAYLSKPIDVADMLRTLAELLDDRAATG